MRTFRCPARQGSGCRGVPATESSLTPVQADALAWLTLLLMGPRLFADCGVQLRLGNARGHSVADHRDPRGILEPGHGGALYFSLPTFRSACSFARDYFLGELRDALDWPTHAAAAGYSTVLHLPACWHCYFCFLRCCPRDVMCAEGAEPPLVFAMRKFFTFDHRGPAGAPPRPKIRFGVGSLLVVVGLIRPAMAWLGIWARREIEYTKSPPKYERMGGQVTFSTEQVTLHPCTIVDLATRMSPMRT